MKPIEPSPTDRRKILQLDTQNRLTPLTTDIARLVRVYNLYGIEKAIKMANAIRLKRELSNVKYAELISCFTHETMLKEE